MPQLARQGKATPKVTRPAKVEKNFRVLPALVPALGIPGDLDRLDVKNDPAGSGTRHPTSSVSRGGELGTEHW